MADCECSVFNLWKLIEPIVGSSPLIAITQSHDFLGRHLCDMKHRISVSVRIRPLTPGSEAPKVSADARGVVTERKVFETVENITAAPASVSQYVIPCKYILREGPPSESQLMTKICPKVMPNRCLWGGATSRSAHESRNGDRSFLIGCS